MTDFEVDPEGLAGLSQRVAAAMGADVGGRETGPSSWATGHPRLSESAAAFAAVWNKKADSARDAAEGVRERLSKASELYTAADQAGAGAADVLEDVVPHRGGTK